MKTTEHCKKRMSQRGIPAALIELVLEHGAIEPSGHTVLTRKELQELSSAVDQLKRVVVKAIDKGGLVVVEEGGALVTTYRLDSKLRRKWGISS